VRFFTAPYRILPIQRHSLDPGNKSTGDRLMTGNVTVRLVNELKSGRFWFEEYHGDYNWARLYGTDSPSEEESRAKLKTELDKPRGDRCEMMGLYSMQETHEANSDLDAGSVITNSLSR
jgi:hypothetical protein